MGIETVAVILLVSTAANALMAGMSEPPEAPIDDEE